MQLRDESCNDQESDLESLVVKRLSWEDDIRMHAVSGHHLTSLLSQATYMPRQLVRYTSLPATLPSSSSEECEPTPQDFEKESPAHHHVLLTRQPYVSLEKLNPVADCHSRKSSIPAAMFNLVVTVCGGGVLSLPLAFSRAGILPTLFLMLFSAIATDFTMYLLVSCARRTGGRTYGDVAQSAFGSGAQVITTASLAFILCGSMIAFQVLVRDVWTPVIYAIVPSFETMLLNLAHGSTRQADNILLGLIQFLVFPLLLKKDLHSLRHMCYVGFLSCILLTLAIVYRAGEHLLQQSKESNQTFSIKWYSTNASDWLFCFPLATVCFFCSFNVLSVHSQLHNPTRARIRAVLDGTMTLCFVLFVVVGVAGYLYAGDNTLDNILLNFPVDDVAILAGRFGYCLNILVGLPLILLPCREAWLAVPEQYRAWKYDAALIDKYKHLGDAREEGVHLIINGIDFDEYSPSLAHSLEKQSQCYGSVASHLSRKDETVATVSSSDDEMIHDTPETDHSEWQEKILHVLSTLLITVFSYTVAVLVQGVASVWSIFGSSMVIWIAFIVPCACYLKIRERKGVTARSVCGWALLLFSCVAAFVCTKQAISDATHH